MISLNSHTAVSRNTCWLIDDTFSSNVVQFKGFPQLNLMKSPCCAQRDLTCFKLWFSLNIISLNLKTCAIHSMKFYILTELNHNLRGQSSSSRPGIWGKGSMPRNLPRLCFPRFSLVGTGHVWVRLSQTSCFDFTSWEVDCWHITGKHSSLECRNTVMAQGKHWTLQSQRTGFQVQFSIN